MEYKIVMPYIGGILSDNGYKYATKATKPIVRIWKRELAHKAEKLGIPKADGYEIRVSGRFTDEKRPDIPNLFKVIGDGLKKTKEYEGLGIDDKHFKLSDSGYELGVLDQGIVITVIPMGVPGGLN